MCFSQDTLVQAVTLTSTVKEDLIFVCGVFSRQFELIKQAHQLYQVSNAMMLKGTHHRVLGMRTSSI